MKKTEIERFEDLFYFSPGISRSMKSIFKKYLYSVLDPEEFSVLEDYLGKRKNDKEITNVMKTFWREKMEESIERPKVNPAYPIKRDL